MKKAVVIFVCVMLVTIVVLMSAVTFAACDTSQEAELHCYVPDGAPALAVANIIDGGKVGKNSVVTSVTTGEDVIAKCQSGEADFAILPTNAAVTVCSARREYCFFSVNIRGLLFLMGTKEVSQLADLVGNKVYSIGLGNTPEYVFKKILDVNGVDYTTSAGINLEYVTDGSTVIPLMLQGKAEFAILGEPAATNLVTKAASQGKTVYRLFDLQQLWQQATESDGFGYPQAGLIVKRELVQNTSFAKALGEMLWANNEFLKDNCAQLNQLMKDAGSSLDVNYTLEILERCNLTAVWAFSAKTDIEKYLSTFAAMQKFLPLSDEIFYEQVG